MASLDNKCNQESSFYFLQFSNCFEKHDSKKLEDQIQTEKPSLRSLVSRGMDRIECACAQKRDRSLNRFATMCSQPSVTEIFEKPRFHILRHIWSFLMIFLWTFLLYEVYDTTLDYMSEKTGSRLGTQQLELDFVQRHFKFTICPRDWISFDKVVENNISMQELRYMMGYISDIYAGTMSVEEVHEIRQKVKRRIADHGSLIDLYRSIMHDFGIPGMDNATIVIPHNGPVYSGLCFSYPNFNLMFAPMGNYMQEASVVLEQDEKRADVDQYFDISHLNDSFVYFHYSGHRMATIASGMHNSYVFNYQSWKYYVRLKHYENYNTRNKPCIANAPDDFYPVGYARDLCAFQCTDIDGFRKKLNCSILPLFDPEKADLAYEQCNYLDPELNWTTVTQDILLQSIQGDCIGKCSTRRYCDEWEIDRTVLTHDPARCIEFKRQTCPSLSVFGWVDSRLENIREYPLRNWNTVISDYGGQLGLFVGVSLSSVVHLLIHWCSLCNKHRPKLGRSISDL